MGRCKGERADFFGIFKKNIIIQILVCGFEFPLFLRFFRFIVRFFKFEEKGKLHSSEN